MIKIMAEPRVLTQRNKEKYTYNGCMFQFDRLSSDCSKKFWRCDRRGEGCKARIHTDIATNQVSIFSVYGMCYAHIRIGFSPFLLDVCLALCCLVLLRHCLVIVASYWLVSSRIAASCCFLFVAGQCRVQTCYICVLSCLTVIRAFAGSHSCGI